MKERLIVREQAVLSSNPPTPAAGFSIIYPKSDGKWYVIFSDGTVTAIT